MDEDWLGTREAAEHLGIGVKLLYRLIEQGQIPAKRERKGRTILVRRRDLDAYLSSTQIAPGELTHLSTAPAMVAAGNS